MVLAFFGGTLSNLLIFYWVIELLPNFTNISLPLSVILVVLLCVYQGIVWMVLAWLTPRLRRVFPRLWMFISPALLVVMEFIMPQLFPYMQGVSHNQVIPIIQLSSLTGVYGVSYLIFWANCVMFDILEGFAKKRILLWKRGVLLVVTVSLVIGYGLLRIQAYNNRITGSDTLRVGLIQANLTTEDTAEMGFFRKHRLYLDLSRQAVERGARWIIWSEGEFPVSLDTGDARRILKQTSRYLNRPVLLGGYAHRNVNGQSVATNSAIHVHPDKGMGERYDKQILVPFGEYMPLEKHLSFIYRKINWTSRFYPGDGPVVQEIEGLSYAFLICYEAIFPRLARAAVNQGARLLVNITYDAWFGKTSAPHQHLMLSTIRSAEMGVPLIRLATTGISTTVNALGKTAGLSSLFKRQVLIYDVPLVVLPTLYSRIGDVFAWGCIFFTLVAVPVGVARERKQSATRINDPLFRTIPQNQRTERPPGPGR